MVSLASATKRVNDEEVHGRYHKKPPQSPGAQSGLSVREGRRTVARSAAPSSSSAAVAVTDGAALSSAASTTCRQLRANSLARVPCERERESGEWAYSTQR